MDAAKFTASHPLNLTEARPDFVTLSFYKLFGYPTGVGALIIRSATAAELKKHYWGGGTVSIAGAGRTASDDVKVFKGRIAEKFEVRFMAKRTCKTSSYNTSKRYCIRMLQMVVAVWEHGTYGTRNHVDYTCVASWAPAKQLTSCFAAGWYGCLLGHCLFEAWLYCFGRGGWHGGYWEAHQLPGQRTTSPARGPQALQWRTGQKQSPTHLLFFFEIGSWLKERNDQKDHDLFAPRIPSFFRAVVLGGHCHVQPWSWTWRWKTSSGPRGYFQHFGRRWCSAQISSIGPMWLSRFLTYGCFAKGPCSK